MLHKYFLYKQVKVRHGYTLHICAPVGVSCYRPALLSYSPQRFTSSSCHGSDICLAIMLWTQLIHVKDQDNKIMLFLFLIYILKPYLTNDLLLLGFSTLRTFWRIFNRFLSGVLFLTLLLNTFCLSLAGAPR